MTAEIINGREIAQTIRHKVLEEIQLLVKKYKVHPNITTIMIGDNPSSALYKKLRDNACREVGINPQQIDFKKDVSEKKILTTIEALNKDPEVHGILIQYPVSGHISSEKLMRTILPEKDVEGFHPLNLGHTFLGEEYLVPCTPQAVMSILEEYKIALECKDVVIINHSNVVGKPLASLLLKRNATVSICHVFTKNLKKYTTQADIIITAVGKPKLITPEHIKEKAIIIDVGIAQTDKGICGDVDFETVLEKAELITPVPGGVGPVTIACSLKNMVVTYKKCVENL
jgi:methylenetetrahydrofolate dehydrogenase (NADP+) / methenyltetrahydrofolate cyclohydrolase